MKTSLLESQFSELTRRFETKIF